MPVNLVVAVTDKDWFEVLRREHDLSEVNFWAPSPASFKALQPGELFLFKLKAPFNAIVGGGVFTHATIMPCSLAWSAFTVGNGAHSFREMRARIASYRSAGQEDRSDFPVGCRILAQPFFWDEPLWLPQPASWAANTVTFKTYSTADGDGRALWDSVQDRLEGARFPAGVAERKERFGAPQLIKPRLGQGAFTLVVADAYERRCAVSRERTLPALEAAHIRPYADGGDHEPSNGLLLRRDIHSLFDAGYVTVTPELRFEVSSRIREEFENGRHYYDLQGAEVFAPSTVGRRPDAAALRWHNEAVFRG
ncbi:MAG: HNH endonuclease [Caulobacterales bacterium]